MHKYCLQNLKWLWIAILLVAIDLATKQWALQTLLPYEKIAITPFFNITLAFNAGAAFSFLHDAAGWQRWFLTAIAIVASVVIVVALLRIKRHELLKIIALMSILGGAIGNLIDRVVYAHVIDFLDFYALGWHFPAFNIADTAITCGACLWFYVVWREERNG